MPVLTPGRAYRQYLAKKQRGVPLTEQDFTTSVGPLLRENYARDISMKNIATNRAIAEFQAKTSYQTSKARTDEFARQFDEKQAATKGLSIKDAIAGYGMIKDTYKGLFKPAAETALTTGAETTAETLAEVPVEYGVETGAELGAKTGAELGVESTAGLELGAEVATEAGTEVAAEGAVEVAAETGAEVGLTEGLGGAAMAGSIGGTGVRMLTKAGMPGHMGGERWTSAAMGAGAGIALTYAAVQLGLLTIGPIGWVAAGVMGAFTGYGGMSGMSVICTELNKQGFLSDELLLLDTVHANKYIDDETYQGYLVWAEKVVYLMQRSRLFTKWIVRPLAMPCVKEMASRVDSRYKGSVFGKIMLKVGVPICRKLGEIVKMREVYHAKPV